jgi:hypothetical protein
MKGVRQFNAEVEEKKGEEEEKEGSTKRRYPYHAQVVDCGWEVERAAAQ